MSNKIYRLTAFVLALLISATSTLNAFALNDFDDRYFLEGIRYYKPNDCTGGSSSGTAAGGEAVISGSTAEEKVWSGLKSLGLTDEVTAGIMGNMRHESGLNPARHEGSYLDTYRGTFDLSGNEGESYGLGLIQWSGSRRVQMYNYVKDSNSSLLKFFNEPFTYSYANGSVYGVDGDKFLQAVENESEADALFSLELTFLVNEELKVKYDGIFDQKTVQDASDYFLFKIERPLNPEGTKGVRRSSSEELFSKYTGKTSFAGGSSGRGTGGSSGRGTSQSRTSATNNGSNVTWIGDSISSRNVKIIKSRWSQADAVKDDSVKGRKTWDVTDGDNKSGQELVEEYEIQGRMRDVLVFALGTNSPHITEETIKNTLNAAKTPKTIVFVTNYDNNDKSKYDSNNKLIRNAKKLDRRVVVADWEKAVENTGNQYFDSSDGVHPNEEGAEYFVETIIRAAKTGYAPTTGGNTTQCVCDEETESGTWANTTMDLSDEQIAGLLAIIKASANNNLEAIKTEASYMINVYEKDNPRYYRSPDGFIEYVRTPVETGGLFPNFGKYNEKYTGYSQDEFNAVKDIFVNGNRSMPASIVERGGDNISSASNDGEEFSPSDRKQYKSGKTVVTQGVKTWIFYKFTVDSDRKGDLFGYPEDYTPSGTSSSTSTSTGSDVAWSSDGWISGGFDGYRRDEASSWGVELDGAANKEFATTSPAGKGKGANKILLHSTETKGGFGDTVKAVFKPSYSNADGRTASRAPHFTIDMKNRVLYQHYSINRTSGAIKDHDDIAGVQIEIFGYTGDETTGDDWNLRNKSNFSTDDWKYLAKLLIAISDQTGIKLESKDIDWTDANKKLSVSEMMEYSGIMGHMHAADNDHADPKDIWKYLEPAIADSMSGTGECQMENSTMYDLNATAIKLAWPEKGHRLDEPTEAYRQALLEPDGVGTLRQGDGCSIIGASCDAFVATVFRHSGVDKEMPCCHVSNLLNHMLNSGKYTEVVNSYDTLQAGDVRISSQHVEMIVEVNGEKVHASASHCDRTAEISGYYDNAPEFKAYRFVGGVGK